jgi:hypothetical protein
MTQEDKEYLDEKFAFTNHQTASLKTTVDKIERGVYGDEDNDVPGLLQNSRDHHRRIKVFEEIKKKAIWISAGVLLVAEAIHYLKELIV